MQRDEETKIAVHEEAGPGYRFLVLDAPGLAADLTPGQFVHVRVPGLEASALRRPFSVFDACDGRVTIMYKVVGRGTAALATAQVGDTVMVEGPLGHGFPETCTGVPLLVGGGYGVAPLHFLARRFVAAGLKPILFVGGRTKSDLLALDRFAVMGVEVRTATNDGSAGAKGFVVDPLDDVLIELRQKGEAFELFTCGPDGLLKAVAQRATGTGMPGWISMDRHMVCGVGACFACIQKIRLPDGSEFNARCCVNGPVFKAEDIIW
ncbi:MAG: dihydroorotate dehydrogenase electron transfer subunit [Kiritimatiellia bacterium]